MTTIVNVSLGLTEHGAIGIRTLWSGVTAGIRSLVGGMTRPRRRIYASGISDEWLRNHAIESAKHSDFA